MRSYWYRVTVLLPIKFHCVFQIEETAFTHSYLFSCSSHDFVFLLQFPCLLNILHAQEPTNLSSAGLKIWVFFFEPVVFLSYFDWTSFPKKTSGSLLTHKYNFIDSLSGANSESVSQAGTSDFQWDLSHAQPPVDDEWSGLSMFL